MILIEFFTNKKDSEPRSIFIVAYHIIGFIPFTDHSCKLLLAQGEVEVFHTSDEMRLKLCPPKKSHGPRRHDYNKPHNPIGYKKDYQPRPYNGPKEYNK